MEANKYTPYIKGGVLACFWYTFSFVAFCRLKHKIVELQTFRQQCGDLEQKANSFMQEKEEFEKEVRMIFGGFHKLQYRNCRLTQINNRKLLSGCFHY